MPNNIKADTEVVISSALNGIGGNPYVGIPLNRPTRLPVKLIERIPGVRPPRFIFTRVEDEVYTLTINGLNVVEQQGKLFAVTEEPAQEWVVRYRAFHDAYTIVKRLDSREEIGWMAPTQDGDRQIRIGRLGEIPTVPPGYLDRELYRFAFPEE
ncbi:hypothetical protein BKA82DRAFT_4113075 [Pisolithus tinctorius]|nr:hypothetical protein BKA82DRAFT_4113075 [Pisolithus tinctorius]